MSRLSEETLAQLISLAINGDQTALKTIMTAYARIVEWKLTQMLGNDSNEADIEELANRVFYKMIRGLPRLKSVSCFASWLMTIAETVAYSYLRVLVRHRKLGKIPERDAEIPIDHQLSQDEQDEVFQVCHQRSADEYDAVIREIDRERAACPFLARVVDSLLRQIFKSLPPQYRAVLWDAIVKELSHDEIAQKHGWSSPSVSRQKLHQARAIIEKLPLPVVTVEIDEQGRTTAFNWNRSPLDPGSPFASL